MRWFKKPDKKHDVEYEETALTVNYPARPGIQDWHSYQTGPAGADQHHTTGLAQEFGTFACR